MRPHVVDLGGLQHSCVGQHFESDGWDVGVDMSVEERLRSGDDDGVPELREAAEQDVAREARPLHDGLGAVSEVERFLGRHDLRRVRRRDPVLPFGVESLFVEQVITHALEEVHEA